MEKETLIFLAEYVGNISPELWKATLNYIHATAWQWLLWGTALIGGGILSGLLDYKFNHCPELKGAGYFISGVLFLISIGCIAAAIGRFCAPEMYAIKYLLYSFNML